MKTTCGVSKCSTPEHQVNRHAVILVALKEQLMREGYIATAHALESAVTAIGWELAEQAKEAKKAKRAWRDSRG